MIWTNVVAAAGTAIIRSVAGWLENAMDDNKISPYEWAQLGATTFRVGLMSFAATGVFGAFIDNQTAAIFAGAGSAIILDMILKAFKITAVKKK